MLHGADRWTRITAIVLVVATLVPKVSWTLTDTSWVWPLGYLGSYPPAQIASVVAWILAAVACYLLVRVRRRAATAALVILPLIAFAIRIPATDVSGLLEGFLRVTSERPPPTYLLQARPVVMLMLTCVVAASAVQSAFPDRRLPRLTVGACGSLALVLLCAPIPTSWAAMALTGNAWGASWLSPLFVLLLLATSIAASAHLAYRSVPGVLTTAIHSLWKWAVAVALIGAYITSEFAGPLYGPAPPLWATLWNVTWAFAFYVASLVLIASSVYRALLLWTRTDTQVQQLEETFG